MTPGSALAFFADGKEQKQRSLSQRRARAGQLHRSKDYTAAPVIIGRRLMRFPAIASLGLLALCALFGIAKADAQSLVPVFSHQFEDGQATLSPQLSYARVGAGPTNGIGTPITLTLSAPTVVDTFVPINSSEPTRLSVIGGGVTVLAGQSMASVTVTALVEGATPVVLSAQFGNAAHSSVRVVGAMEVPGFSITPLNPHVMPGGLRTLTVMPLIPPPPGGTLAGFSVSPVGAGSTSAPTLDFPADTLAAQTINYTDANVVGQSSVTVQASGGPASSTNIIVAPIGKLVINEVDYDNVSNPDTREFIEIYNRSPDIVPLMGVSVVLINGTSGPGTQYAGYDLGAAATQLAPGQYLVIRQADVALPVGTAFIDFSPPPGENVIHNGVSDGLAIVDVEAQALIDALSYEGSIIAASIPGFSSPVSLVEGMSTSVVDSNTVVGSLSRFPNGIDANNAATDFHFATTLTPGAANQ